MSAREQQLLALKAEWTRLEREAFGIADTARSARLRAEMAAVRSQVREIERASGFSPLSINSAELR